MKFISKNANLGALFLRIIVGGLFLFHGITKLNGIDGTIGFFGGLGFAPFVAYFIAWIETIGGALMLLGWLTEVIAPLFAFIMLVAIFKVKQGNFKSSELELALLFAALAVFFTGPGRYVVPCWKKKTNGTPSTPASTPAARV